MELDGAITGLVVVLFRCPGVVVFIYSLVVLKAVVVVTGVVEVITFLVVDKIWGMIGVKNPGISFFLGAGNLGGGTLSECSEHLGESHSRRHSIGITVVPSWYMLSTMEKSSF